MSLIWQEHVKNRNEFPPEDLEKYAGQHVAWGLDGKRILAGDPDPLQLLATLQSAGYTGDDCVLSFVDDFTGRHVFTLFPGDEEIVE